MPKLKQVIKSVVDEALHDSNQASLDACIKALASGDIQLRRVGDIGDAIKPLTEGELRALNLDLGALHFQDDLLTQCLKKFADHDLVKYEGVGDVINAGEEVLQKAAEHVDEL